MDVAWSHYLRRILHEPGFSWPPYFALYPVIPWIGVMGLGWVMGDYLNRTEPERLSSLKIPLVAVGVSSIVMFFVVRWLNGYGNLVYRWSNDIIDWLYISKYPPSISYLLWTLGGMCIFMTIGVILQERNWSKKNLSGAIHTFGRTPLFFYLTHLWLYRLRLPRTPAPFHLNLAQTLGLWMIGLIVLWQMCLHYEKIKRRYPRFLQYI
jgi:uncharacterized membrane protein